MDQTSDEADHEKLPLLYARWMSEFLAAPIPRESNATCNSCAMCDTSPAAASTGPDISFDPTVKCCSFVPTLPNFLAGMILADDRDETARGRASLRERMAVRVTTTPLGVTMRPSYRLLYDATHRRAFGRSAELRCPHFLLETGGCGIWQYRNSVCTTWFCKHVRGATGQAFWRRLRDLLLTIEHELALVTALELVSDPTMVLEMADRPQRVDDAALVHEVMPSLAEVQARRQWGDWFGREEEFYRACAGRVRDLSWPQVLAACGARAAAAAKLVTNAFRAMHETELPARIRRSAFSTRRDDPAIASSYSGFDQVRVSERVLGILHYFDGSATDETLARIATREGLRLKPALVRRMLDFRVIEPVPPDSETTPSRISPSRAERATSLPARAG